MAGRGGGDQREGLPRSRRKFEEVGDMLIILTVVMAAWVQAHVRMNQMYQIIYLKYVQFMVCQLHSTKPIKQ